MKVGYARVSTAGQSLDAQLEQLGKLDKIFQEKMSGKSMRPEMLNMIQYVREGDQVIVTKLDRLARSTKDLLEILDQLQNKGVSLKILNINLDTGTPTGKLMVTMLGAIAQFERELMLERQAEGIIRAKAAGKYKGRQPTAMEKAPEVFELQGRGLSKAATARKLGISESSVRRIISGKSTQCVEKSQ